jgi:pyruvate dehydrogenase E2 component (dihydrolipoamide acetyltransferase)
MAEAKATIPHFYLLAEVDMSGIEGLRASCASLPGWKSPPTYSVLLVRAIGLTLARLPSHNLVMHEGRPARHPSTDVGLAVATPAGLIAPVMRDVASKPLLQVAARVQALVEGARAGRLNASDLGPHAVTLSNLGMQGVDAFIGIIDPPGTMLLAVGRVTDRVVARDGQVAIRPMLTLAGSFDHRAFDGALAAAFVDQLRQLLENPSELMGEGALS